MNEPKLVQMEPAVSDSDHAADVRAALRPVLEQACDIINGAKRHGLVVSFGLNPDQFGIHRVGDIGVTKPL